MSKIAYIIECMYNSGGMERVLSVCANALCQDVDISIVTLYQKGQPPYFQLDNRIRCYDLGVENVADGKRLKQRMSDFLMEHHFDIVISMGGIDMYQLHSIKDSSKKIVWFHFAIDIAETTWAGPNPRLVTRIKAKLQTWKRIYNACKYDKIVVISKADVEVWQKFTKKAKLIYNPVTIDTPTLSDLKTKKVISVGRLDFQKGFDFLIDAWKIVNEKNPEWQLDIYGEGPLREHLQTQIDKLQLTRSIKLCGRTSNITKEYVQHSIYVMSSRAEGLGLVLLEAACCGLPLVAFDCPSGPSEIIKDGQNGFLISKVGDVSTMAFKISQLIESEYLRRQMGNEAKRMVEKSFSITVIMEEWKNLIMTVI